MAKVKKTNEKNGSWWIGILASLALLLVFLNLQADNSNLLALDIKWLVIASIPLLIAILRSDIIQKFKGFGIELETRLQKPITSIALTARDALQNLPGDEKASLEYLHHLPEPERAKIQRLVFRTTHADRYRIEAIEAYLSSLRNIKFIEVTDRDGKFIALLPINIFRKGNNIDKENLRLFLQALHTNEFPAHFKAAITQTISDDDDLLDALQQVRNSKSGSLPVITKDGYLLGVATLRIIESKIADEVLSARGKS